MPQNDPTSVTLIMRHFHPVLAGAAERFRRYAPGLAQRGVRLSVFASHEPVSAPERELIDGFIPIWRLPTRSSGAHEDRALFNLAEERLMTCDDFNPHIIQTTLARRAITPSLWRLRRRGFFMIHAGTMVDEPFTHPPLLQRLRMRLSHQWNYLPFHRCIASTKTMADWHQRMGIPGKKIRVIPSGVNTQRFRPTDSPAEKFALRESLGIPIERPVVLFVGNILPRKGLHLLMQAWQSVHQHPQHPLLIIVGAWERQTVISSSAQGELQVYQEKLRALLRRFPEDSYRLIAESPRIEDWYRAADLFVLPSEREGMVNVVMEAMSSGLPTLVTEHTGMPVDELGPTNSTHLLIRREENEITLHMRRLIENPSLRSVLSVNARQHCVSQLSLERTLDAYSKLYHNRACLGV
jgi:glycosyltransferase involved in cell wall biosynthesis